MTDVQLEHGYTRIANEILENLALLKINATQHKIILVVLRYTYGFQRKEHNLSASFLAEATDCDKRQIIRELLDLEQRRIITQKIRSGVTRIIGFNKNFDEWVRISACKTNGKSTNGKSTSGENTNGESTTPTSGEITTGTSGESTTQERNNLNKNLKEKNTISNQYDSKSAYTDDFESFWKMYPRKKEKQSAYKAWKARIKDGVNPQDIISAAGNYAAYCEASQTEDRYMKHGSTFLGPNKPYEDYITYSPSQQAATGHKEPKSWGALRNVRDRYQNQNESGETANGTDSNDEYKRRGFY